jgi:hypothetical protein
LVDTLEDAYSWCLCGYRCESSEEETTLSLPEDSRIKDTIV